MISEQITINVKKYWGEFVFVFSNTYSMALSMISSIVATAFIDPEDMGVIQQFLLIQVYLNFMHLGVFNGLNRNLAYYKAKNNVELVQDMVNTTYSVSIIVAFIGAIVSIVLGLHTLLSGKSAVYVGASVLLFFLLVFSPLINGIEITYRSGQEFKRLGIIKNIETTLYAVFSLLPILLGYIGKVVADSFRQIIGFLMRYRQKSYQYTGKGSLKSLKMLLNTGFPILVSGYLWSVYVACDRTFIANFLTNRDLGLYSLAGYVITAVMVIPTAVNTLLYPKAATRYGQTNDTHSLFAFWKKSLFMYVLMLVPICVLLYFLLPLLVPIFMPKYVDGIKAAQYALLTCMTFVSSGPSVIFGTLRKNIKYIYVLVFSIALFWVVAYVFRDVFNSIENISLLRFGISFLQMISILWLTYKYTKK